MLKSLNLAMNGLSFDGCSSLAAAIQQNDSLTHLNLSNTRLKDAEATKLVQALSKNEQLTHLDVSTEPLDTIAVSLCLKSKY